MFDPHRLEIFFVAAIILAITPGPGILYVLGRTLHGGRREGVLSSLGTFVGGLIYVLAAAAGLSIVLATSAVAFAIVKYAGAAYLIYLGVRMIFDGRANPQAEVLSRKSVNPFWQGIVTEVLNPKTALFFLSFIPQFISREHGSIFLQFGVLGTISVMLNTTSDLIVAWLAQSASACLPQPRCASASERRQGSR
jgi:threonine/homoserine/homoserine lactone efflux protein